MSLMVVGSLAYDSIKTPYGNSDRTLGGSANYFSIAASLFSEVAVVGVVGEDYQDSDRQKLLDRKVNLEGLQVQKGKTFCWSGEYSGDMNEAKTLSTHLNVFENFQPNIPEKYKKSDFAFLANIDPVLQLDVLNQISEPKFIGADTMNFWIQSKKDDLLKVISKIDILLINDIEARMLTGTDITPLAAKKILDLGPKFVVIKRGEFGFFCQSKNNSNNIFSLPAFPTEKVVDPTGAGDSFAGAFFGYLSSLNKSPSEQDVRMACVYGTLVSSYTVEGLGLSALETITIDDVMSRMRLYKDCQQF